MIDVSTVHRSDGRFYIKREATRVTLTFEGADGASNRCVGQLTDLSQHSVRIEVDGKVDPDQLVTIRIEVDGDSIVLELDGIVRWQQPRCAKNWSTCCELTEPLESDVLERLAVVHVLNRRRDPRYLTDKPAKVRTELSSDVHDVRLINYSKGGFGLLFSEPVHLPHERLMLLIPVADREVTVPARVMWTGVTDESFGVGCAFITRDGYAQVRSYADPKVVPLNVVGKPIRNSLRVWIALAMTVALALYVTGVIPQQPQIRATLRQQWTDWFIRPFRDPIAPSNDGSKDPNSG